MERTCSCGCGKTTSGGIYLPGHDQRLRGQIEKRVGGLAKLDQIVTAVEVFVAGGSSADDLGKQMTALLGAPATTSSVVPPR